MSTQIDLGPVLSVPKGDWNADTIYERLNLVRHNSASWICNVATSKGVEPTEDSTDWYLQVKDTSSVTSVNGMKGDVVIELTETETPPANDNSNRIATTEWVTDKLGDVDLSGIKDDTIEAALNASSLKVGMGELTSAEIVKELENKLSTSGGEITGSITTPVGGCLSYTLDSSYKYISLQSDIADCGFLAFSSDSPTHANNVWMRSKRPDGSYHMVKVMPDGVTCNNSPILNVPDYNATIVLATQAGQYTVPATGFLVPAITNINSSSSLSITIGSFHGNYYQGYSGTDYNHASAPVLPVKKNVPIKINSLENVAIYLIPCV